MTIPDTIRVGTVTYQLLNTTDDWLKYNENLLERIGVTIHANAIILIHPGLPDDVTRLTVWHEVLHCVFAAMGSPNWSAIGDDYDEFMASALESPTLQVLRDNPELVHYLTETR